MSIHGTDPLEGLEEGSSKYLQTKKRLAENDLHHREGEIRVTETSIGTTKKFIRHSAGTTLLAVAFTAVTASIAHNFLTTEGPVDARAKTACTDLAKKFQTPATPEALSLCEQKAREHIQEKDHDNQITGVKAAFLSAVGLLFAGLRFRRYLSDIEELIQRKRELEGYQSNASETREEIKGLDERLASLDLG
jgi:hypothetical protein